MSYANMDGVPTQTAGTSELLASDWNTYVRDNFDSIKFGHVVCTSSTRPTGIGEGTMIYETDTQFVRVYDGSNWIIVNNVNSAAYQYVTTVYFTTSGSFTKASYPYLRALRVRVQGAGGGGGGSDGTDANSVAAGAGGGGGAYGERFVTDITGLAASETITVGAGGAGGYGFATGTTGGSSVAFSLTAAGGVGGAGGNDTAGGTLVAYGGAGGAVSGTYDFSVSGGTGGRGLVVAGTRLGSGEGGSSILGNATAPVETSNGTAGKTYGSGGSGACTQPSGGPFTGGVGGAGIVILDLFA